MTNDNDKIMRCPICDKSVKGRHGLRSHMGRKHNDSSKIKDITDSKENIIVRKYKEGKNIEEISDRIFVTEQVVNYVIEKRDDVERRKALGSNYKDSKICEFCGEKIEKIEVSKYCSKTCGKMAQIDPDYFHVFYRDHFRCRYCGRTPADNVKLTIDHVYPKSKGGGSGKINLVTTCQHCNSRKSDRVWPKDRIKEVMLQNRRLQSEAKELNYEEILAEFKDEYPDDEFPNLSGGA